MADDDRRKLDKPLLTADDVAGLLGLTRASVYEYAKRGLIPAVRIGKHYRFSQVDIEEALRLKT